MDLADRQIVGWSLSGNMTAEATTIPAWKQGVRSAMSCCSIPIRAYSTLALALRNWYKPSRSTQSMSRKGNCLDNAPAESFFKTIKAELPVDTSGWSYGQVRRVVFNYIDIWYNRKASGLPNPGTNGTVVNNLTPTSCITCVTHGLFFCCNSSFWVGNCDTSSCIL